VKKVPENPKNVFVPEVKLFITFSVLLYPAVPDANPRFPDRLPYTINIKIPNNPRPKSPDNTFSALPIIEAALLAMVLTPFS
jgi:uncharacterized membrane protein